MPGRAGRPPVPINWDVFAALCAVQCTLQEIANYFECSRATIENAVRREHHIRFSEYYAQKASRGTIALRRKQHQVAMEGNPTMLIWLGKQILHQHERSELTGPDGGPIQTEDVSQFSRSERRRQMRELMRRGNLLRLEA
jgi:hypothetical protein